MSLFFSLIFIVVISNKGAKSQEDSEDLGNDCVEDQNCRYRHHLGCFSGVCDKRFIYHERGEFNCSGSFDVEEISNLDECKNSAGYTLDDGPKYFEYSVNSSSRPKGCYTSHWNVFWNNHNTGGTSSSSSPICKRVPGCRCKNIVNAEGEGRCNNKPALLEFGAGGAKPFCYVEQPSSCTDLRNSNLEGMYGEKYSNIACRQRKEDQPECNIKVGYSIDGHPTFEGHAGSAENCFQLVRLREPRANGIKWYSDKTCKAVFGSTQINPGCSTCQSCIFGNKNCFTKEGHTCIFPFKYGGKEYKSCYSGYGGYWCPYSVNDDLTHNEWDWCQIDNCSETNQN